jgi:hypothetical protein
MEPGPQDFPLYIHPIGTELVQPAMKDFDPRHPHGLHSTLSDTDFYQDSPVSDFRPMAKVEEFTDMVFNQTSLGEDYVHAPTTQLQLADLELDPSWRVPTSYAQMLQISNLAVPSSNVSAVTSLQQHRVPISPPHSTYHFFDEVALRTPWSSPEYTSCKPVSTIDDEDELVDDKPYARLIYEALMQAPGNRMMLRDIYEWFRKNTTKAQDNATNGWQNSIRHNLSMNKVRFPT